MRPTIPHALVLLALAFVGVSSSRAQFVSPTSYSFSVQPNNVSGNYYPDSGNELKDGALGTTWSSVGNYDVWTGWHNTGPAPSLTFQFATAQTFTRIELGAISYSAAAIGLPRSVAIGGGGATNLAGNELTDDTRGWLVFDGSFSTALNGTLTIDLGTSYSQWIMLDEVRFTSAIPEPAESALLVSLLAVGAFVAARKMNRRSANAA